MSIFTTSRALKESLVEIPVTSPLYPAKWQALSDKPPVLYALGNTSLLRERTLCVVGSRKTPVNALRLGAEICKTLSESFTLLTGTADGGDSAGIEGALAGSGRVICLLAGGFSSLPQSNLGLLERVLDRGLLLSPHSFEKEVRPYSYEYRNKLLAKLSDGVFVLGAGEKSGALITARYAARYEKPIFALPYPPNSAAGAGCNALIKRGGYLTESAEDIAEYYGVSLREKRAEILLSPEEKRVCDAVREGIELHVNEIAEKTGLPPYKLRAILSALEVKGALASTGGNRYCIV